MKDAPLIPCIDCGLTIAARSWSHVRCELCALKRKRAYNAARWRGSAEVREEHRAKKAAWRAANPELSAAKGRLLRYGITLEEFATRLAEQGGRCAICRTDEPSGRGWHLDHDHSKDLKDKEGHRGILCHACNTGLGGFRDNIPMLERASAYLECHRLGIKVLSCG